jgi:nicotinamide phosphoribosyltransferase
MIITDLLTLINPLLLTDGYKTGHHLQYPVGTTLVYSNFTPRANKYAPNNTSNVVSFGQQMVMMFIDEIFRINFFNRPKEEVCGEMKTELSLYLNTDYDVTHFEELHDLGYLPIHVKAIQEGTLVPIKIPVLTIFNTVKRFFWIPNYLETIISNLLWKPMTSATIAYEFRKVLERWQKKTDRHNTSIVDFQGHDFSMRGLDSVFATISSGLGHLTSFLGSDSLPTIFGARKYYGETGFVTGSVNATEHSVMCAGSKEGEIDTFIRLIEMYKDGVLSIVSDTWDLWTVIVKYLPKLKDKILARNGKLVIRPDSGDPVDILCGINTKECKYTDEEMEHPSFKGVVELLWDIFGGTINDQGYKVLDPNIGAIYGDSITIKKGDEIARRLEQKGFASTNVILGIGSFTYQYNTRDSFGFAMKATYVEIDGVGREIFKDPLTDSGLKKSAKGLMQVYRLTGSHGMSNYLLKDQATWEEEAQGELKTIYKDGVFTNKTTLTQIRERLKNQYHN